MLFVIVKRLCSVCKEQKLRGDFSSKQFKKVNKTQRICRTCQKHNLQGEKLFHKMKEIKIKLNQGWRHLRPLFYSQRKWDIEGLENDITILEAQQHDITILEAQQQHMKILEARVLQQTVAKRDDEIRELKKQIRTHVCVCVC